MKDIISWTTKDYAATLSITSLGELYIDANLRAGGYSGEFLAFADTACDMIDDAMRFADIEKHIFLFDEVKNLKYEDKILQDAASQFVIAIMDAMNNDHLMLEPTESLAATITRWYTLI